MKIALDTNAYSDAARGHRALKDAIQSAEEIYLPFVVVGELRAGFACGVQSLRNEAALSRFLNSKRVFLLFADEATTHFYARIFAYLKANGTPIPTNDLWISALIWQHDLPLVTSDAHFAKVPQIVVI
jgi:tRNA(fMet)-specific endonuclease VapC